MNRNTLLTSFICLGLVLFLAGCGEKADASANNPPLPPATVEHEENTGFVKVDRPDQFPLVTAGERTEAPELDVTGSVNPDVSRNIPVISLASGRVVEIHARIGDAVTKGQLLLRIQSSDISQAFSDYRQALADDKLASKELERSQLLYGKGAIAQKDVEVAEDAEAKTKVTVETTMEHLRLLGADMSHPERADRNTWHRSPESSSNKTLPPRPASRLWIIRPTCSRLPTRPRCGSSATFMRTTCLRSHRRICGHSSQRVSQSNSERAESPISVPSWIPISAPPRSGWKLRIPAISCASGMFVTATFHGMDAQRHATVPAAAILHLHDRDWVYVPAEGGAVPAGGSGGRKDAAGQDCRRLFPGSSLANR